VFLIEFALTPERGARHFRLAEFESAVRADSDMVVFSSHRIANGLNIGLQNILDEKAAAASFQIEFKQDIGKHRIRFVGDG
jgi:hypothetical protein